MLLVGLATGAGLAAVPSDRVASGVQVGQVDVSGLGREDAERRIAEGFAGQVEAPVALVAEDEVLVPLPGDLPADALSCFF